ncbi:hypothetical protein ALC62_01695 [Cyphomyrmex costatus]|uniref:Uncharacterized protein n=2 Tax=Cyphomyrmex costatus TaxID=456900 RepID=A0A195D3L7_9HYME|nr:hypothetical protein ALC62_01695 [Cyphomyrmex costatus]
MSVNMQDLKEGEDRFVTDSVHQRFQQMHLRCEECNQDILGNWNAIRKHYDDSHPPSDKRCRYCFGNVFKYRTIPADSTEFSESFLYHKCKCTEEQPKTGALKESM